MDAIPRTVRGRIARMDEMIETKNGRKVLRFGVAENSSYRNGKGEWIDRETVFTRCEAWNDLAERIEAELSVGTPTVFIGEPRARSFETEDKQKRTSQWIAVFAGGEDLGVKPSKQAQGDAEPEPEATTAGPAAGDPYDE